MALNVLIVDDSPMMRNIVGRILDLSGMEIGARLDAADGSEALRLMEREKVDLVLVDINMPVMNGEELVREMNRKEQLRSLPVVVISSDGTSRRKERMKGLGVYGYLEKPFRPEDLRDEVERIINLPRLTEEEVNAAVANAVTRVLETMCFACVGEIASAELDEQSTPMGVAVQFAGSLDGEFELWVSREVAASLAISSLGIRDEESASVNCQAMLNELANMMCGAALSELQPDGEFHLESPGVVVRAPGSTTAGQHIECDDGSIWVSLEVGPSRWNAKK